MVRLHILDRFRHLHDSSSASIGRLQRGDYEIGRGERREARERQLRGAIEQDEIVSSSHFSDETERTKHNRLHAAAAITSVISAKRVRDSGRLVLSAQTRRRI